MIQHRIAFPSQAKFDRVIPKTKIYSNSDASKVLKELFVADVEQIKWSYKLAPETINLPATRSVSEIQVFRVVLRSDNRVDDVLRAIDKAIPYPILFELYLDEQFCYGATFKRPNEADSSKWVIGDYFFSGWMKEDVAELSLPVSINLNVLYHNLLKDIIPYETREVESLTDFIDRVEQIRKLTREAERVEKRMNKEKQFNRRVELNRELNTLKSDIKALR